jgi:hypothetical protein
MNTKASLSKSSLTRSFGAIGACCVLLGLAVFSSASFAQSRGGAGSGCGPAGYVHEVSGAGTIARASAKEAPAKVGDQFESETVFRTGPDEKTILKFADGQVVALGPNSVLHIGRYCFVAGDLRQSVSNLDLQRGEMRVVTGLIGETNRDGMRISAGDSMLSILKSGGADFTVLVTPEPEEVGAAVVARGEISVRTPYGPIYKIDAGQYAPWQPGRTPPPPLPITAAPAVIQAAVAGLWSLVVPTNAPVNVASAARMTVIATAATLTQAAGSEQKLAGYVDAASSNVLIRSATGKAQNASAGNTFEAGTTFTTGADGGAVLKFADGQVVVLGPNSIFTIDQYQFDPRDVKAGKAALDLDNGAMRVVTGSIHAENRDATSITAGASIVSILSTGPADFTIAVNTKDKEVGVARVSVGEISVHTPYGQIDKIRIEQSNLWGPRNTPDEPVAVGSSLGVVQAAVALQLSGLPDDAPVAVAPAAKAVAAVAEANRAQAAANADPSNTRLQAAAQSAADAASAATLAANAASQAVAAAIFASALTALPATASGPAATASGPAQAQVATAPPLAMPVAPIATTVTPGAAGGCLGSKC